MQQINNCLIKEIKRSIVCLGTYYVLAIDDRKYLQIKVIGDGI